MLNNIESIPSLVLLSKGFRNQQWSIQLSKLRTSLPSVGRKSKGQTADAGCTHCANPKHTREICFKLYGYPEWWKELKERKKREADIKEEIRKANMVSLVLNTDPAVEYSSGQGNTGCGLFCSQQDSSAS